MKAEQIKLAAEMAEGSREAFDALYQSYSAKLYRMAYFITGNRWDSEDILQETFVKCYLHRKELKNPQCLESWLYQILVRTARRANRKKQDKRELSFEGLLEDQESSNMAERLARDTRTEAPLDRVLKKETIRELREAVEQLDEKHRIVVLLYYYNECSTKEIAAITGTFEGTVKSRLYKSRKILKASLEQMEQDDGQERRMCHES